MSKSCHETSGCGCAGGRDVSGRAEIIKLSIGSALFAAAIILPRIVAADYIHLAYHMSIQHVSIVLYIAAYLILGGEIIIRALSNILRGRVFDENFLMSGATIGAFAIGEYPEAVTVMLFYRIGEYFQELAVRRSKKSIAELMDIRPDCANIIRDGECVKVDPNNVNVGDIIIVKPGEKIPLDGIVTSGESLIDTAAMTGESIPRKAKAGDNALAGCINQTGALTIRVTKIFGESTVAKIIELAQNASAKKAPTEKFITTFSRYYTPVVVALAALIAVIPPLFVGGAVWSDWIHRGLVFLVISCPCALVISIPLSFFGGIGGASKRGVLVKGGNYLEALANLDIVVFDKTGTLTRGVFEVTDIKPSNNVSVDELLKFAATAETFSNHPIARSILNAFNARAGGNYIDDGIDDDVCGDDICDDDDRDDRNSNNGNDRNDNDDNNNRDNRNNNNDDRRDDNCNDCRYVIDKSSLTNYTEIAGLGVCVTSNNKIIAAGNHKLMKSMNISCEELVDNIGTIIYIAVDNVFAGRIIISDEIKPDSRAALAALKSKGVRKTVMLSGDNFHIVKAVADELSVDEVYGDLLPHEKLKTLEHIDAQKRARGKLAFVGDGVNDALALARADVGIAMGGLGSDAAIEAADVVLMTDEPSKLISAIDVARFTKRIVTQNIVLALAAKALFLYLGARGVAGMWEAVFADVGVALLAVFNASRIGSKR